MHTLANSAGRLRVPDRAPGTARPGVDKVWTMRTLVLLRHGESEWNSKGLFTGWVDVGLSGTGAQEAAKGGALLAQAGRRPRGGDTPVLNPGSQNADNALAEGGPARVPG